MGVRENIIRLRTLSAMTQEEFGAIAGVTRSAVSQWEGGFSEPRMGNVEKLAAHFNIPKSWIVDDYGMNVATRDSLGRIVEKFDSHRFNDQHVQDDALNDQLGEASRLFIQLDDDSRVLVLSLMQGLVNKNKS